jgi:hypothetical protein
VRLRRHKGGAFLLRLPDDFARGDAASFGKLVFRQHHSVPFFLASAYRHRNIFVFGMRHRFHGGKKAVAVAMYYNSVHSYGQTFLLS